MKYNYIVIQGWMVTELKLSSNDLLVYGLIYGFCQDGESEFTGSINYVCNWLNCTRPTAMKALKNLVDKGLIFKEIKIYNNVIFNRYKVNLGVVKNLKVGSKETLSDGSKDTLPNNTNLFNNIVDKDNNTLFEKFWDMYPVKVARKDCLKKFIGLSKKTQDLIFETLPSFIAYKPFETYTHPNPLTYLNKERWNDVIVSYKINNTQPNKHEGFQERILANLEKQYGH